MTIKTFLAAAILATIPVLGAAQCMGSHAKAPDEQAMTCLPGTMWDLETGTCLPVASS
jgi:hypothetical protein